MKELYNKIKKTTTLLLVLSFLLSIFYNNNNIFASEEGYTINFRNVPAIQYIKFVGEVCQKNFVYDEAEINFNVTVVSKEEIKPENAMSTLLQILRIHDLALLNNGDNIVIHKNPAVKEIAPIVDKDLDESCASIVTKVFKIENSDPGTLAGIIKPMISTAANVEVMANTRQIIISDIAENIKKIDQLINILDTAEDIFIYKARYLSKNELKNSMQQIANDLKENNFAQTSLIDAINRHNYIEETNSFLFTGSADSITKIKEILSKIDVPARSLEEKQMSFFTYMPQNRTLHDMEKAIHELSKNLSESKLANSALISTLKNVAVIESTRSLLFTGDSDSIKQIQDILAKFDSKEDADKIQQTYYIYKLQKTSGNIIEEDLDHFAEKLKSQKVENPSLLHVLENAKWVKETNSILLTGEPKALEAARAIIEDFDVVRHQQEITTHSDFYIYKPKFASPLFIDQSLKDTASNLEKAKLADPNLLNAINNLRIIESTGSLAFTGTPQAITKIKNILKDIDTPVAEENYIHTLGKETYLYYKIKKANPQHLINTISSLSKDLKATKVTDKAFLAALESLKYQSQSHTLLFTGTPHALEKVKNVLEKFDTEALSQPLSAASAYFVYKPKFLSGPDLEEILENFANHLKNTGFDNPSLFATIQTMKFNKDTNSIIFSGDSSSIEEIKKLLVTFDVAKSGEDGDIIQPMSDISFLVYKLQYHKGDEIQNALKQIAKELQIAEARIKKDLLNAINSIQWIQVTNSLLCSGSSDTMSKLKGLIANLDVPLKQVFIEMLVIETTFTNLLNFGLDWGGKYKHKEKFVAGVSNSPYTSTSADPNSFIQGLNKLDQNTKVAGSSLGLTQGFDLGIIGDIILHKGRSFLSLGSFLQAVQQDQEASIVMTPKLLAQDSKTSSVFIGSNVPYIGSQTNFSGASSNITKNLEYRDIGMNLTMTPVLGNSDTVTLSIDLSRTVEDPSESTSTDLNDVQGIRTSKTTMQTTVHIPNQSFLVLSGMVQETKQRVKTGIPCLGGLPLIGAAFSENDKQEDRRNIVIFIRPHIINSYEDMQNLTETQEDYFRSETGSPILENDFDEACDFYKTYDDE